MLFLKVTECTFHDRESVNTEELLSYKDFYISWGSLLDIHVFMQNDDGSTHCYTEE